MNWNLMALAVILLGIAWLLYMGYKKVKKKQAKGELPKDYSPFERINQMAREKEEKAKAELDMADVKPQDIKILK